VDLAQLPTVGCGGGDKLVLDGEGAVNAVAGALLGLVVQAATVTAVAMTSTPSERRSLAPRATFMVCSALPC
jgi:hypothetical protein